MQKPLRVLNVEDSTRDEALLKRHLTSAGYDLTGWERVDRPEAMLAALTSTEWDIILCDYAMPHFDALKAMALLRETAIDLPFIIISGTVGEEVAVKAMLTGAHDYLSKDKLTRLVPAIERELKEANNRRELRAVEVARLVSEERYRALFDYAPDGIIISGPDDYYLDANASMCTMLGYAHRELVGLHASDIVIRSEARELDAEFALVQSETDYNREWHFKRKDGSVFPAEVIATIMPDGNLLAMIRDSSERTVADDKLRESEYLLAASQRITHQGSWIIDLCESGNGEMIRERWSNEHYRIFGFEPGQIEVNADNFYNSVHEDDRERLAETLRLAIEEKAPFDIEHRIVLPDGSERIVQAMAEVIVEAKTGKPIKVVGSVQDITGRKKAEALLLESQERLILAAESARLGIWDWDVVADKMEWDDRMYELYGIKAEDFSGAYDAWQKGLHPDDLAVGEENIRAALADEKPFINEFRVVWPNGEVHTLEARASVRRDPSGKPLRMIGVNWDVTERKDLENQVRQSQKMEAVGVLAGGIAHDFNNLLTAINGFSDLTLRKMEADSPFRRNIEEVHKAGVRAAELTSQLLTFSRKEALNPSVINLNSVISNIEMMLRRVIRESIELNVILEPGVCNVVADSGQIEQVIMNLTINARDAMPDGGSLTIETKNVQLDAHFAEQHIMSAPGDYVRLTVSDTGEGMDLATSSHIFEPFFTTKEKGKGTGLGLATVYGIVKQSGGAISVYSEVGHGTVFKVYLPCVNLTVENPLWPAEDEVSNGGTETILFVEDDDSVRAFVMEVLESSGYNVLAANGGRAALQLCESYSGQIDMLISDVIMPKMGGSELKNHVVKLFPDIKVLFISGYTDDSIASQRIDDHSIAFLEKPFSPETFIKKIRTVLEAVDQEPS